MSVYSCLKSEKPIFHNIFPEMLKTDRYDQLPGNQNVLSFFLNPKKKMFWPIVDWLFNSELLSTFFS